MKDNDDSTLSSNAKNAIAAGLRNGIGSDAIACYIRWTQIETWLRQLVHLEMSAAYGTEWISKLESKIEHRARNNIRNEYMLSPDEDSLLAHGDTSDLFNLIKQHWSYFESALVPQIRWAGCADELISIRNRIAHSRRPHVDDLSRLEQTLRNLEPGAKKTLMSYSSSQLSFRSAESFVASYFNTPFEWSHISAHAKNQYRMHFHIEIMHRPWMDTRNFAMGNPGILLRAKWRIRDGYVIPSEVWEVICKSFDDHKLIVHYVQDIASQIDIIFSGMDSSEQVSRMIENCFDAIIPNIKKYRDSDACERSYNNWTNDSDRLDPRCHINDLFAHADRIDLYPIFGA